MVRILFVVAIFIFLEAPNLLAQQQFVDETANRLPEIIDLSKGAALGDIDLDGDIDVLVSNGSNGVPWTPDKLLLNDGSGQFTDGTEGRIPVISLVLSWAFFADIERDDDLDFYIGNRYNYDRLYVNGGNGVFTEETVERVPYDEDTQTHDVEFGDLDGDLDLDFVLVQYKYTYEPNLLFLNDHTGHFTVGPPSWFPQDMENSEAVALGDIDGDFDLDVVIANELDAPNRIWINDGTAHFVDETSERLPEEIGQHNDVKLTDVDGDGDLDILFAKGWFPSYEKLYLNDGNGYFTDVSEERVPEYNDVSNDAEFVDVDNDGDYDLLISNRSSGGVPSRLFINDGNGYFTDGTSGRFPAREEESTDMAIGDFDNDGDADIFISLEGEYPNGAQNRLLINLSSADSIPPVIVRTFNHPDTGDTTNPYIITSTVWDNISVAKGELHVSLFYKAQGEQDFTERMMYDCDGFIYRKDIPAQHSGTKLEYYIKARDKMGNTSFDPATAPDSLYSFMVTGTGIAEGEPGSKIPPSFSLSQNFPNPFNPSTTILYDVPANAGEANNLNLAIYDIRGRLVKSLIDSKQVNPGSHRVLWSGTDELGKPVPSGVYFYLLRCGDWTSSRKMTCVR